MDYRESLQILRNELVRRGLPRDYIERVTGELADHADDVAAETARAATQSHSRSHISAVALPDSTARLGDPVRSAADLARQYQRRTFLGRHPWWTFVTLPAGAMLAAWIVAALGICLLVEPLILLGGETPSHPLRWTVVVLSTVSAYAMTYGTPALLCWWALRKVRQTTRRSSWAWAATAVVVASSFILRLDIFRLDDGLFGIDSTWMLHWVINYLVFGESVEGITLWQAFKIWGLPNGCLVQAVAMFGMTAYLLRRYRQNLAMLATIGPAEQAEAA